jgi:hypothetical protein
MTKISSLTLVAAAFTAALSLAAPALADDIASTPFDDDAVYSMLASRGVHATELGLWGNKIRATVVLADGSSEFQFFDQTTLQRVDVGAPNRNSRVLSELDVGGRGAQQDSVPLSLTYSEQDN